MEQFSKGHWLLDTILLRNCLPVCFSTLQFAVHLPFPHYDNCCHRRCFIHIQRWRMVLLTKSQDQNGRLVRGFDSPEFFLWSLGPILIRSTRSTPFVSWRIQFSRWPFPSSERTYAVSNSSWVRSWQASYIWQLYGCLFFLIMSWCWCMNCVRCPTSENALWYSPWTEHI